MRSVSILLVLAWMGCHHAKPRTPGDEYLAAVDFEGNKQISDEALLDGLVLHRTLKAGRAPDPYQVQVDRDRLKSQYNRDGFFEADVQSRTERVKDASTVTYTIYEGPRATTKVSITGLPDDPDITPEMVRAKLPLRDGAPFDYDAYDLAKTDLVGVVQDAGYAHAKLDARVHGDIATHTAIVQLDYAPGPKCKFGDVTIQGVDGDLRGAVIARVQFAPGQTYSNAAITATQRALYGMGRFSTVQVQPDSEQGVVVGVKVAVVESARHQITLGGGFGIDPLSLEVRGRAGYEVTGWPGPLYRAAIDLRPAYAYLREGNGYEPRMRALARLERDDLFLTYAKGTLEGGYNYLAYEAYTEYGPQARLGYDLPLGTPHLKLHGDYFIHRYEFRNANPAVDEALQMQLGIDHPELVAGFRESLIVDFRDHPVEPRWGAYAELKATEGTKYAGSDYLYRQISPEVRGFAPIGPVVLAARARYGAFIGDLPPTERFFAGGATSQRGFSERKLAPSVMGVPYGGGALIDSSVEARFPLTTVKRMPLGGVVFLDGADVTESRADLDPMNLHWAAGFGLRLATIIGPARADFGYRLNRKGAGEPDAGSDFAFHLSLGEAF